MGRLNLSLYGIRTEAQNWAVEYTRTLRAAGFEPGRASPCNFTHKTRDLALTVHGDDFTATGPVEDLAWLEEVFRSRYDIKASVLGPDTHQAQEIKILGRTLRWTAGGIEYEADTRHQEIVIKELCLEDCSPVFTPFGPEGQRVPTESGEALEGEEATRYRALVARLNCIALDRPDIQYAVKDAAKRMSAPCAPPPPRLETAQEVGTLP